MITCEVCLVVEDKERGEGTVAALVVLLWMLTEPGAYRVGRDAAEGVLESLCQKHRRIAKKGAQQALAEEEIYG